MSSDGDPGSTIGGGSARAPSTNSGHPPGEAQRSFVAAVARAALKQQVGAQRSIKQFEHTCVCPCGTAGWLHLRFGRVVGTAQVGDNKSCSHVLVAS